MEQNLSVKSLSIFSVDGKRPVCWSSLCCVCKRDPVSCALANAQQERARVRECKEHGNVRVREHVPVRERERARAETSVFSHVRVSRGLAYTNRSDNSPSKPNFQQSSSWEGDSEQSGRIR